MKKILLFSLLIFSLIPVFGQVDIDVSHTDNKTYFVLNNTRVYTVRVENKGTIAATDVLVKCEIPTGIAEFSWTGPVIINPIPSNQFYPSGTNKRLNYTIPSIPVGETRIFTITLKVPNTFNGNLVTEVTAMPAASQPDPNPLNNISIDTDILGVGADIEVQNSNIGLTYVPGTTKIYTVKVRNNGPLAATNVNVTNAIPVGITQFSWTGNSASGTNVALNNVIATLAVDQTVVYTITMAIPATFTGNLSSIASASSTLVDQFPSNSTATDVDTTAQFTDVFVINSNPPTNYVPGTNYVYTMTVGNIGNIAATNVIVQNIMPSGVSGFSWVGSNGSSGTNVDLYQTIPILLVGQIFTATITVITPLLFDRVILHKAEVSTAIVDPKILNNKFEFNTYPPLGADLTITNTNNQTIYVPGSTSIYQIQVTNNGPSTAYNVSISNAIPTGIINFSWVGSNGSSGNNVGLNDFLPTIANGQSVSYTITIQIPLSLTGDLTSAVNISSLSIDPTPTCLLCTDTDTRAVGADLVVTNTDNKTKYTVGTNNVYIVTVKNNGPSAAANVSVVNIIPAGITNFSWTGSNGSSGTNVGLSNIIPSLPVGASVVYTITMAVPATFTGNLVSVASATSTTPDPFPGCLQCTDTDTRFNGADVVLTNSNNQTVYTTGQTVTYILNVTNLGPETAENITVQNPIPLSITSFVWSGSNGSSGTNVALTNTIPSLTIGSSVVYTITMVIPASFTGNLVNIASVSSTSLDPVTACSNCTDTDIPATSGADLEISITNNQTIYTLGSTSTYLISLQNNGPDVATNVNVNNLIPAGITQFSWTGSNGSSGTNVSLNNIIPSMAVGATLTYSITLTIPLTFVGNLTSIVSVTATTIDPNPITACSNCIDTDIPAIVGADLVLSNTNNQTIYTPGATATYIISVLNNGPDVATNVNVINLIPAGITQFSWTGSNGSSGTNVSLNNVVPSMAVGATVTYTISLVIPATFVGDLTSIASVSATTIDPNPICLACSDTDTKINQSRLLVNYSDGITNYIPGQFNNYTLTVTNNSLDTATNIQVNSAIPLNTTQFSWTGSNGSSGIGIPLNNTIPSLIGGGIVTYAVRLYIPFSFVNNLTSSVSVTYTAPNPIVVCSPCIDVDSPTAPILSIVNSDNNATYIAGQSRTYTITVTNNGATVLNNIAITNNVPSGISSIPIYSNPPTNTILVNGMTWSGNSGFGTGNMNVNIPTLNAGQTIVYTVIVAIPSNYNQSQNLVSSVAYTLNGLAPPNGCVSCLDIDTPTPFANIVAVKTDGSPTFLRNSINTYAINIRNEGPSVANNVVVSDAIPQGISIMTWSGSNGSSGTGALNDVIPVLAVGQTINYIVSVTVPNFFSAPPGNNLTNTVVINSTTPDPTPVCPTCVDFNTPRPDFVTINTDSFTVTQLVKDILIDSPCIEISNITSTLSCGFGYFNRNSSAFPFKDGIVIRNGTAKSTEGKYTGLDITTRCSTPLGSDPNTTGNDPELKAINVANGNLGHISDASSVKFNFKPSSSEFSFNFLFASQEYGTYQCGFSDAFAFILTDLVTGEIKNLAIIPNSIPPKVVAVTSIRKQLFNAGCPDSYPAFFGSYNSDTCPIPANCGIGNVAASTINMKGQTIPMTAKATVVPNRNYSIKLVIGDYIDQAFDSAVFIEGGSFKLGEPVITGTGPLLGITNFSICRNRVTRIQASTIANPTITYSWTRNGVPVGGNTHFLDIDSEGFYEVTFTYAGGCFLKDNRTIVFAPGAPVLQNANNLTRCLGSTSFNLTVNEPVVIGSLPAGDFGDTTYHTLLSDAEIGAAPLSNAEIINYPGSNDQPIFMRLEYLPDNTCAPIKEFRLFIQTASPSGSFSYPDDAIPGFCKNSNANLLPTLSTSFSSGGVFSVTPNIGLLINPTTGALNLTGAIPGVYAINYTASNECFTYNAATVTATITACIATVMDDIPPVCVGEPITLTTSNAGSGVTYTWLNGTVIMGTSILPSFVIPTASLPTLDGIYPFTVSAVFGLETAVTSTKNAIIKKPEASFGTATDFSICTGASTTLTIVGTPNAFVRYTNGTTISTVQLSNASPTGISVINVPVLSASTTYTLIDARGDTLPDCLHMFPTSATPTRVITISVGAPSATMVATNTRTCSGIGINVAVSGTPLSVVTYSVNGVTSPTTLTLSAAGTADIPTGIINNGGTAPITNTYALISVAITGTNACSANISGQQTIVTINPLPSATFSVTPATICPNTSATLNFVGKAGDIVTYINANAASTTLTATIGATGTVSVSTGILATNTTFSLVKVDRPSTNCTSPLSGNTTINIGALTAIATVGQPVSATKCVNETVTFTTTATGDNLSYQWRRNGVNLPTNSTSNTYTIAVIILANAGNYTCVVTGTCGVVTSSTATLVVTPLANIIVNPIATLTVCSGNPINLSVAATGTGILTYQWKLNGANVLVNGTSSTLNIPTSVVADGGSYVCFVSNAGCEAVQSNASVVTVNQAPSIVTPPISSTVCVNETITLSVVTAGGSGVTYQWRLNGADIPLATAATYTKNNAQIIDAGNYTCVIKSIPCADLISSSATITMIPQAIITSNSVVPVVLCADAPLNLSITATGVGLTYQWKRNGVNVTNAGGSATTNNLIIPITTIADSGDYTCEIGNLPCSPITTATRTVTINASEQITTQPSSQTKCSGETLTLSMVTTGGFGATFQWEKDNAPINGATGTIYVKSGVIPGDSGTYRCRIISFPCADKFSDLAVIVVNPAPVASIAAVGNGNSICYDTASTIAFSGTPNAVVVYTINGGANQSLTLSPTGVPINITTGVLTENAIYQLISVTTSGAAACPTVLSQSLTIIVNPLPETTMPKEGFICLEPLTGTTFQNYIMKTGLDPAVYSFVWYKGSSIIAGATQPDYEATTVGTYKVIITNIATNCKTTAVVEIEPSTPPQRITAEVTAFFADNSTIVVTATPNGDYEYRLDFGPYQNSNVFEMVEGGSHEISVRDKKECRTLVYSITVVDFPRFFTPNGDGFHDTWNIGILKNQPDARLIIFDRFGKLLKQISTTGDGWNGTFNGQELPADDYWFTLEYSEKGIQKVFKSHFSLKR